MSPNLGFARAFVLPAVFVLSALAGGCLAGGGSDGGNQQDGFGSGVQSGGSCVGAATPCSLLSTDECMPSMCSWTSEQGYCAEYQGGGISECLDVGCDWSVLDDYCFKSHDSCYGETPRCEELDAYFCTRQPGCMWQSACPVNAPAPPACAACLGESCCEEMSACAEGSECGALVDCEFEMCSTASDLGPCLQANCGHLLGALPARDALVMCASNCSEC